MRRLALLGTSAVVALALIGACGSDDEGGGTAAGGSAGASGAGGGSSGSGGASGSGGGSGSGGASGGSAGSGGATGGGAGVDAGAGAGGTAGADAAADAPVEAGWPTCDMQPSGVTAKTIKQIWTDNPTSPTQVWVNGVYVTAVSGGGCNAGSSCQIFVQQAETYASFAAGAQQAIKLRISDQVSQHFTGIAVGDQLDVLGNAWRFTLGGVNELVIQVNAQLQGCAKKVGTGSPTPITGVQLSELTLNAYEQSHGPLLVQVASVSGKPAGPGEIFGIWATGVGIGDASATELVSVSPFFLSGFQFTGLPTDGQTTVDFTSVTGVFGQFVPFDEAGSPPKYHVLYPRTIGELVKP
jgi:hypothetical protein